MTPGFHEIPAWQYHADPCVVPSLSASIAVKLLRGSPLKAWHSHPRLNPDYRETHDGKFDLGTSAHGVLLENDASNIVIVKADDWRTKAAKEQRAAAYAAGKTPLLERHHAAVTRMVDVARVFVAQSEIAEHWSSAQSEVTGIANEGKVWLRCRFDRITHNRRVIMDYKTTEDSSPDSFSRLLVRMGYHIQDAFYRRVARNLGVVGPRFVFLAQEVEPPHECALHACDPALEEIADAEVELAIRSWRECIERKQWPSYGGRIHYATPTAWQIAEHEMRLAEAA